MKIIHYGDLSGGEHETFFVRWGTNRKHWIDACLEDLSQREFNSMARRIENFANGTLPLNISQQFESYESLGEPVIYAVKYPTHSHRFYCFYDEINGRKAAVFFYYLSKKTTAIPAKEQKNLRQRRDCYFAEKENMEIIEAEGEENEFDQ